MPIPFFGKWKAAVRRPNRLEGREMEECSLISEGRTTIFNLETLRNATGNFHEDNMLGMGGFGPVYKGTLTDGKEIAVKKLSLNSGQGHTEFLNEVKLLAKLLHKNLVHIFGCCAEGSERLIVYEFLPHNSLDRILFDPLLSRQLDWKMRFNIILGIARGLIYLHEDSRKGIIHRDIKASNILLDQRMNPKISDFGLARLFVDGESHVFTRIAGTMGYMAPEYVLSGQLSVKADVYSYGVLLLEIVCGKRNMDFELYAEKQNLIELVWRSFERRHAVDVIDTQIVENGGEEQGMRCIHVGLLCTQANPSLRPSMSSVYSMLSNPAMTNLPHPVSHGYLDVTNDGMSSQSDFCESGSIADTEEEPQDTQATSNLTYKEIIKMKRYCNDHYIIGEGSFGKVYRGNFRRGYVAIKKIKLTSKESRTLAENEVRLLHGKDHKNLVRLMAWCIEEREFYLVYEYVEGCTLQNYLRENCIGHYLGWEQCLKLIRGIAEGIQFLHNNQIIHVDIKPENLMLGGADGKIKIIDFGFSRHVNWEGTHRSTGRITGTRGYWAPEYCLNHKLSYKHDVYSFGIVVLEVITGQKHVDDSRGSSQFHIPEYVEYMMGKNRFEEAVDQRIKDDGWDEDDVKSAMAVAVLALRCADKDDKERPHMDCVVRSLNSVAINNIRWNRRTHRNPFSTVSSSIAATASSTTPSLNDGCWSDLEGR